MPQNTVNHVSVPAKDIDESVDFYVELFGPESCERIPTPNFGFGVPAQWIRIGDCQLHLFVLDIPIAPRYYHFGVSATGVDQFHRIYRLAADRGILDSQTFGHHVYELPGGCAQLYVVDPAGNLVEIDWRDASELDPGIVTDIKRIADRAEQSEDNLRSSLFLDRLMERGWEPSGELAVAGGEEDR